jgi:hypothetical protein
MMAMLALTVVACNRATDNNTAPAVNGASAAASSICGGPVLPISQIQGRSLASPLAGQRVAIEAIVTAKAPTLGGVFVQEEQADRDGDTLTSEALFILTDGATLAAGQHVRAEGIVVEHGEQGSTVTALADLGSLLVCGDGEMPDSYVIEQPPLMSDDWEALENMRVTLEPSATVLAPDLWWSRKELLVSLTGRQFAPTEVALPGDEARKRQSDNARSRLLLSATEFGSPQVLSALPRSSAKAPWRVGTELDGVSGIFSQSIFGYRVLLDEPPRVSQAPRPEQAPDTTGDLRVMSFNTLNLFNGDGKGGEFPTPRGASDPAEWERQLDKQIAVLTATKADVIALMELENDPGDPESAEAQLVKRLNKALGKAGDYAAVTSPQLPLGDDQIRVGLLYRKSRLELRGEAQTTLAAPFDDLHRPPLLQSFTDRKSKESFAVVANHFKSKGGCDRAAPGNHDREDGQACFNAARVDAARALAGWLDQVVGPPDQTRTLLLGDFNAYAMEDPIRLLADRGYARVRVAGLDYSFVYDGASGSLDHALASTRMRQSIGTAAVWHINADEATLFDYQKDDPRRSDAGKVYRADVYRSSDHDPLLVGLSLTASAEANAPASADPR